MENWQRVLRTEQPKLEAYLRCEKQKFLTRLLTRGIENLHTKIYQRFEQQLEHDIAECFPVYRNMAALASYYGLPEVIPDETVLVSRLVRGFQRRAQQKQVPVLTARRPAPGVLEIPEGVDIINIPDDIDPPSTVSLSGFDSWAAVNIKAEPPEEQPDLAANRQTDDSAPNAWVQHHQPGKDGSSHQSGTNSKKRARVDDGPFFSETIKAEPTELGSIHCKEVENQDWIFSHEKFPGFLFVIRCDRGGDRSHTNHIFSTHPLKCSRAASHFYREKHKDFKCHGEEVCDAYTDTQLIIKFGYRVYGDDLQDPAWVARSNQNAEKGGCNTTSTPITYSTRSATQQTSVGNLVRTGQRAAQDKPSLEGYYNTSQLTGSSSTKRARRHGPEFGPARRSRPDQSPYAARDSSSRLKLGDPNARVAPVPEMSIFNPPPPEQCETMAQPVIHASSVVHVATTQPAPASLPKASTSQGKCSALEDFGQDNLVVSDLVAPSKK